MNKPGNAMYKMAQMLWPINRSITGKGLRQSLNIISKYLPNLIIKKVPSGTKVFDWVVPEEWNVKEAYIITPGGRKICDLKKNNLHLMSYSTPIKKVIELEELEKHLYSLPDKPNAIPYVTSYYEKRWGFCIKHKDRKALKKGKYQVLIKSSFIKGHLNYGELIIPGRLKKEVFLSTYICHPSMANNELSGPVVTTYIAKWIYSLRKKKYTYRIIFIPETIGSITYLSKNLNYLKKNVIAGYNVNCMGDDRSYSYLPSRYGDTLSDIVAQHVLKWTDKSFRSYTWKDRGSDERQYCSPGVNLPIASIMRTKFREYSEYHTSLDKLGTVVKPNGLEGGFYALQRAIEVIEKNISPIIKTPCEPQLGKRGLFPTLSNASNKTLEKKTRLLMDFISWCDGDNSLLDIAEKCNVPVWELYPLVEDLKKFRLISYR